MCSGLKYLVQNFFVDSRTEQPRSNVPKTAENNMKKVQENPPKS